MDKENGPLIVPLPSFPSKNTLNEIRPLSAKNSMNELRRSESPHKRPKSPQTNHDQEISTLQRDYNRLERSYTDVLLAKRGLEHDITQLQHELQERDAMVQEQTDKLVKCEAFIRTSQDEYAKNKELLTKENHYYRELISELQVKVKKLSGEVNSAKNDKKKASNKETSSTEDLQQMVQMSEKFNKLLIDFKVLQSNFELERNSRLVLIDQIELLTKENEMLSTKTSSKNSIHDDEFRGDSAGTAVESPDLNQTPHMQILSNSVDYHIHTMNELTDEDEEDEVDTTNFLPDVSEDNFSESLEIKNHFKFPPSPDHSIRNKRMSLPLKLRTPQSEHDEFVLSPLKLTTNSHTHSKPAHHRFSSHDFIPISVEFERRDALNALEGHNEEKKEKRPSMETHEQRRTLDGQTDRRSFYDDLSRRDSSTTNSSKRSSLVEPLDISKEDFVKLRFELQSLKLHNEKLLSYIGFELQKQKKSIKKLSSKQSMRTLRELSEVSKQIEYSDAKLIEQSKDMLINKKRVLRSVSINPIVSKNYGRDSLGLGILTDIDDDDEYGFLNHNQKFTKRVFSNGLQAYLGVDEDDPDDEDHEVRKHRSQLLTKSIELDDIETDTSSEEEVGMLKQIQYLILGPGAKKSKKKEQLVDDNLRLKFLTISIGIIIVGLKLSHQNHN